MAREKTKIKRRFNSSIHICFIDGMWYAFKNKWKADWFRNHGPTNCRYAKTIPELTQVLKKGPF